jgi:hypothetical protein
MMSATWLAWGIPEVADSVPEPVVVVPGVFALLACDVGDVEVDEVVLPPHPARKNSESAAKGRA